MKEVRLKRVAGPYNTIPFDNFIQSPIGLVPKDGGKQTRLIFHLSYDCKRDGLPSVNHLIPKEESSVHYQDLDYAVKAYFRVCQDGDGSEATFGKTQDQQYLSRNQLENRWKNEFELHKRMGKQIFGGKSDLKSAFCLLGLSPDSWPWMIMKAQNPVTGEWVFFVDKCLPFGASISCAHFQRFSNALCHLIEHRTNTRGRVTNYLDDFLFLALTLMRCNYLISSFLQLCEELRIPISYEKTEWGSLRVIFLGILLNGRSFTLSIPSDKHRRAVEMIRELMDKKKAKVKDLQSLCGFLNFISRAVFPERTFTRRMYAKFSKVIELKGLNPRTANP